MTIERDGGGILGFIQAASWHNLRQLMLLRNVAIAAQAAVIVVVDQVLDIPLPIPRLAPVVACLALFNLATFCRLRRPRPVTEREVFGQILVDVGALTALLYAGGGAGNPFIGLFLVPVTIAAASLRWRYALSVVVLTLVCYSLLLFFHVPLAGALNPGGGDGLLILGMWVSYLVSTGLIAYFVMTVSAVLRRQGRALADDAQRDMTREYLVRVGALAAGAAHEIRSPLATMAVLVKELQQQYDDRMKLTESLRIMSDQIDACRRTLSDLVTCREPDAGAPGVRARPVDGFLDEIVKRWRLFRPGVRLACRWTGCRPAPAIHAERSLEHAVVNLLNNAADASPQSVELICRWSPGALKIVVQDRGPGFPAALGEFLGELSVSTKRDKGTGIGLLLAKTAVRRAGGTLMLSNRSGGGARAEVVLPLSRPRNTSVSQPQAAARELRRRGSGTRGVGT
jgi:two-component system, sensor histidine kinase RegB